MFRNIIKFSFTSPYKNPYLTLGIPSSASEEQIKAAYYKLAKLYHPDIGPENSDRFKNISEAYSLLKDPIKVWLTRKQIDRAINPPRYQPQDININDFYSATHKQFKQGARYEYPSYGDHYTFRKFNKQYIKRKTFSPNEMRPMYRTYNPFNSSKLLFLTFVAFFGCIIMVQLLINFYKIAQYQRGSVQYESVPYDLQAEDDDY